MKFTLLGLFYFITAIAICLGFIRWQINSFKRDQEARNLWILGATDEQTHQKVWLVAGDRVKWDIGHRCLYGTVDRIPILHGKPDMFSCFIHWDEYTINGKVVSSHVDYHSQSYLVRMTPVERQ